MLSGRIFQIKDDEIFFFIEGTLRIIMILGQKFFFEYQKSDFKLQNVSKFVIKITQKTCLFICEMSQSMFRIGQYQIDHPVYVMKGWF